ncbi:MAG: DUF4397 domain-containing protein [Sphingobacteriaceae bacterium]
MKTCKNNKKNNCQFFALFALLGLVSLVFFACDKNESRINIRNGSANIMAVNASPDAKPTDFYIEKTKINAEPLTYNNHTNYVMVESGTKKTEFKSSTDNTVLASSTLNLVDKANYTIFFAGNVATPEVILVADDLSAPGAGKAKVRFVNLSPDETKLDVRVIGGDKIAIGRDYKSVTDFTEVDPGVLKYELLNNQDASVVLTMPEFSVDAGKIYTIWIKGTKNGTNDAALGANILEHTK